MRINSPLCITPNLLPGCKIGDAWVTIGYSSYPAKNGRTRYHWHIELPEKQFGGEDLQSGCQGGNLQEGFTSLLSFLSAFAEAQNFLGSENYDLFPDELTDWAIENSDEFSLLRLKLEETKDVIVE